MKPFHDTRHRLSFSAGDYLGRHLSRNLINGVILTFAYLFLLGPILLVALAPVRLRAARLCGISA